MYLRNFFTLDGIASTDFGVWTNGYKTFGGTTRDVDLLQVPGRHGDLVKDNKRFENVEIQYEDCGIVRQGALLKYEELRNFLSVHSDGYYRLEDTYHPDEYRLARFVGPLDPEIGDRYETAKFDLLFDCKPQHYLKSGEEWSTDPVSLRNPTMFNAEPLIRIYGTGTVQIGSETVTVTSHSYEYIDLDCALGDARYGAYNANQYVTMTDVPKLVPGITGVTSTATSVMVQPRWWKT